ncbi:hypothetical protein ACFOGG_06010 [Brenneria rubrifaciens]|uniref:hypothetical protein n=1 Tax=Brenneria rubrifaciens TaxID=55213 RepID=UPI00360F579F
MVLASAGICFRRRRGERLSAVAFAQQTRLAGFAGSPASQTGLVFFVTLSHPPKNF